MATSSAGTGAQPSTRTAPGPYAIIETGGKQYRVAVGDRLSIEKLPSEAGADVTFERVLMIGGDGAPRVGTPVISGASVSATIEEQYRGPKIVVFKYKPKKRYRRRTGHRQALTRVAITAINA
jgi:large subunit ribosomal protein L21